MESISHISHAPETAQTTASQALLDHRRNNVRLALQQAVEKSWLHAEKILSDWGHYARVCADNGIASLSDVLCDEFRNGKTYFEEAIDSGNPRTLRCLHRYVESGIYVDGKIVRNNDSLYKVIDKETGVGFGYLAEPQDTFFTGYVGEILHGERHGWGRLDYGLHDFYEGNWDHGKRHGFGKLHRETPRKTTIREVFFDQDEPKKLLRKTDSPSKLDFFKRIKTMVYPF